MQKQKGISTLVGIIIIIAVALVAFGGVFAYQYFAPKTQPVVQTQQNQNQNNQTAQPSITSISPNPAMIGSVVTVTGVNLNGFEGDKNLWIENSTGQKGVIYGDRSGTGNTIKFTLASSYCTADNSYSGLPCPSYITMDPGTYNIYAIPWGAMSNKVSFSIVAPN